MTEIASNSPEKPIALWREAGNLIWQTATLPAAAIPLAKIMAHDQDITREELHNALDVLFDKLYEHPITQKTGRLTQFLRDKKMIPNEQSTENLIKFVVEQSVARSPVPVPSVLIDEFWRFFNELFANEELKGLGELSLDMSRLVLQTYEPLLVESLNILKAARRFNQWQLSELTRRANVVRQDVIIMRRQMKALRYLKPFFQTDPKDFSKQAEIVAQMVREFGPFFIKLAQAAAANADFLPEEIARELAVFHEDVPPMKAEEVRQAFMECFGQTPEQRYLGFDANKPLKSGSIGSVYLAKKAFLEADGREHLRTVVVKVGRHHLDREFAIGKMVIALAIMSSQYWAPHSKLAPFLHAWSAQMDEFVKGFQQELDFNREANNQIKFFERAANSQFWRVPELYEATHRILEMEYIDNAKSLHQLMVHLSQNKPKKTVRSMQRSISEKLVYSLFLQVFNFGEIHGDLHPGNILVHNDGTIYLIDWGNKIDLHGKWRNVLEYISGCLSADINKLTQALIRMSTDPAHNHARHAEIEMNLNQVLDKKQIKTLTLYNSIPQLHQEGLLGLQQRLNTAVHLISNTQSLGLIVHSDYLHLSRSLVSLVGSFGTVYSGNSRWQIAYDMVRSAVQVPILALRDKFHF